MKSIAIGGVGAALSIGVALWFLKPATALKLSPAERRAHRRAAMRFVGHRGASHVAPENTLAAFRAALRKVGAFEMDLSVLSSGEVIVLHDDTLRRTASSTDTSLLDQPVTELTWAQVRDVDVGSWLDAKWASERLPMLNMTLQLLHQPQVAQGQHEHRPILPHCYAELKANGSSAEFSYDPKLPGAAEAVVTAGGIGPDQLTWISFSAAMMVEMKRRMPEFTCLLISMANTSDEAWEVARECVDGGLDGIDLIASEQVVTPDLVAWMHGHGKIVAVWVWRAPAKNDNPRMWAAMADMGVDVFTTNVPPALEQWLAEATD